MLPKMDLKAVALAVSLLVAVAIANPQRPVLLVERDPEPLVVTPGKKPFTGTALLQGGIVISWSDTRTAHSYQKSTEPRTEAGNAK
jgi:hypothetical protein